jgi:hypothetical protein
MAVNGCCVPLILKNLKTDSLTIKMGYDVTDLGCPYTERIMEGKPAAARQTFVCARVCVCVTTDLSPRYLHEG